MHRILLAVFSSIALAAAMVVSAGASGPKHASAQLVARGSIYHLAARTMTRVQTASTSKETTDTATKEKDTESATEEKDTATEEKDTNTEEKDAEDGLGSLHFGPFASSSGDSGTCGPDWANDQFNRVFTVGTNPDGTPRVVEFFKNGTFVTLAGSSPGACENGPDNGGKVTAGIKGHFQGYFLIQVTGGSLNRAAHCTAAADSCGTTAGFIKTVFGPGATYKVTTFLFNYTSKDKLLIAHHWRNASADRGGNAGDIRTS